MITDSNILDLNPPNKTLPNEHVKETITKGNSEETEIGETSKENEYNE